VVGRLWAEKMKPLLGTVVTENRGGGGGVTGAAEVAARRPDGHTFLFGNTSTQVLIPVIMTRPPYDALKDFTGVYILCMSPTSIVVHESVPARSLVELIAYAKANPNKLSYGSAGAGTLTKPRGRAVQAADRAPRHRAHSYKGSAPGVADLASGHIPMMTPNVGGPLLDFHRAGKVRILAVNARRASRRRPTFRPRSKRACRHDRRQSQRAVRSRRRGQADRRQHRRGDAPGHGGCGRSAHPGGVRLRADPRFRTRRDAAIHQRGACALDADHEGDRLQDGVRSRPALAPCTVLPSPKEKDPMARVPLIQEQDHPNCGMIEKFRAGRRGKLINIYRMLLNAPPLPRAGSITPIRCDGRRRFPAGCARS
jgi:hypothetical protein